MFSADGLNHASPCVCKTQRRDETKKVEKVRCVVMYLSEDMVQQSIICVVIHGLVVLKQ